MRYRRALRSHSELLTKVTNKYLEAQDIAVRLKGEVGGACDLHFDMLWYLKLGTAVVLTMYTRVVFLDVQNGALI